MGAVLTRDELVRALREAGVRAGDVLHVQGALWPVGPVEGATGRKAILDFYLSAFQEVLGPSGTLTVCTSFEDYGRYGTPFVREESPSRLGVFSEHVRTRPGAVRSMHPIISVTALGARADEICGGPHHDGFGHLSPWARLHRADARLLVLGLPIRLALTFMHLIEQMHGVPYTYTKLFSYPVLSGGREEPGPFTMSVRYLDFSIAWDFTRFERRLLEAGAAVEVPVGRSFIQVTTGRAVVDLGLEALARDRFFFLKEPPRFRPGECPTDGPTGPSRPVYHAPGPNVSRATTSPPAP